MKAVKTKTQVVAVSQLKRNDEFMAFCDREYNRVRVWAVQGNQVIVTICRRRSDRYSLHFAPTATVEVFDRVDTFFGQGVK